RIAGGPRQRMLAGRLLATPLSLAQRARGPEALRPRLATGLPFSDARDCPGTRFLRQFRVAKIAKCVTITEPSVVLSGRPTPEAQGSSRVRRIFLRAVHQG